MERRPADARGREPGSQGAREPALGGVECRSRKARRLGCVHGMGAQKKEGQGQGSHVVSDVGGVRIAVFAELLGWHPHG